MIDSNDGHVGGNSKSGRNNLNDFSFDSFQVNNLNKPV